jgi:hypothetical protein
MSLELHVIEFSVGREAQVMGKKQRKLNRTRKVSKTRGFLRLAAGILLLVSAVVVWRTVSTHSPMASSAVAASAPEPASSKANFLPTVPNVAPTPDSTPEGEQTISGFAG